MMLFFSNSIFLVLFFLLLIGLHLQKCELKLSGLGAKLSWHISNLKGDCKLRKTCIKKRKCDTEGSIWIQVDEFYFEESKLLLTTKEAADFDFMIEAHFFTQSTEWVESERVSLYDSFDILAKKQEEISGEILFALHKDI